MTARLLTGARGETVYAEREPVLGDIRFDVLDPDRDLDVLHRWVGEPRARFWGLGDLDRDALRDLYAYVDALPSHHAFLVHRRDEPVMLLQTYEPEHDPVGACYDVAEGDVGVHVLIGARGAPVRGFSTRLLAVVARFVFAPPAARRIVVEPDVRNHAAVDRMLRSGFVPGPEIVVGGKTARLAFLTRP